LSGSNFKQGEEACSYTGTLSKKDFRNSKYEEGVVLEGFHWDEGFL